jgi:hypothetical protein
VLSPGHTLTPSLQSLIPEEAQADITGMELDVDGGVSQY